MKVGILRCQQTEDMQSAIRKKVGPDIRIIDYTH